MVMDGLGRGWGECTLLVRPIMLFCGFVVRYLELGTVAGGERTTRPLMALPLSRGSRFLRLSILMVLMLNRWNQG